MLDSRYSAKTLAFALTDSPAGLAAWIVEKFRAWSDCAGDIETVFTRDRPSREYCIGSRARSVRPSGPIILVHMAHGRSRRLKSSSFPPVIVSSLVG
jgi:hypothetical protein